MRLARWDHIGYDDLRLAAEASQRKLHKCRRATAAAARRPVTPLLGRLASALGMPLVAGLVAGLSVDAVLHSSAEAGEEGNAAEAEDSDADAKVRIDVSAATAPAPKPAAHSPALALFAMPQESAGALKVGKVHVEIEAGAQSVHDAVLAALRAHVGAAVQGMAALAVALAARSYRSCCELVILWLTCSFVDVLANMGEAEDELLS